MKTIQGDECFETLDLKQYLIFYFTASWCGPCQAIAPKIQELSDQLDPEKIRFFKIDIDEEENNEICDICKIKSVPSFLLFKDRTYLDRIQGANLELIKKMIIDYVKVEEEEKREEKEKYQENKNINNTIDGN
ncbi:MAG: hypothetical protein CL470_00750 [Acidimicrobiaceae bacterium]|nr:hypothetical protein [Acidimicrobiaceae bacterium]|tara:strand:- start:226 stop:624 length:399 start_codon:yes stop_codon:yes gene_type:complete